MTASTNIFTRTTIIQHSGRRRAYFLMNLNLKEYDDSNRDIADWLPWFGIIHPNVLQNKDESLLAVLEYSPFPEQLSFNCKIPEIGNGWAIWTEKQHFPEFERFFITILWYPQISSGIITNLPDEFEDFTDDTEENKINGFIEAVWRIMLPITNFTKSRWLRNQEIINFLSDTLTNGLQQLPPELTKECQEPIDLDGLISQDSGIFFSGNYINIGNKSFIIASFPSGASREDMYVLYDRFWEMNYRHTQRLLLFSPDKAEKELRRYTAKWCPGRASIKELICKDILGEINGYYSNIFVFAVDSDKISESKAYIDRVFRSLQLNLIIESFNFKDVWWGSIAGIYSANIPNPPITGFNSITELLIQQKEKRD